MLVPLDVPVAFSLGCAEVLSFWQEWVGIVLEACKFVGVQNICVLREMPDDDHSANPSTFFFFLALVTLTPYSPLNRPLIWINGGLEGDHEVFFTITLLPHEAYSETVQPTSIL